MADGWLVPKVDNACGSCDSSLLPSELKFAAMQYDTAKDLTTQHEQRKLKREVQWYR